MFTTWCILKVIVFIVVNDVDAKNKNIDSIESRFIVYKKSIKMCLSRKCWFRAVVEFYPNMTLFCMSKSGMISKTENGFLANVLSVRTYDARADFVEITGGYVFEYRRTPEWEQQRDKIIIHSRISHYHSVAEWLDIRYRAQLKLLTIF